MVLAGFERQIKIRTEEGGADLGDQLFAGIAGIAEALATEVPVEAGGMACPVRLMPRSA